MQVLALVALSELQKVASSNRLSTHVGTWVEVEIGHGLQLDSALSWLLYRPRLRDLEGDNSSILLFDVCKRLSNVALFAFFRS